MNGKENVVEFDFLGKDSIRYYNWIPVERQVFKNLNLFVRDKQPSDDLFDRLTVREREGGEREREGGGGRERESYPPFFPSLLDHCPEQVPTGANGGTDCQSVQNLQRLDHSAGAA